jgi:catechol 2,3-dioxygenase-like lactoylglutathione lyase family enzyme
MVSPGCRIQTAAFDINREGHPEEAPKPRIRGAQTSMTRTTHITRVGTIVLPVSDQERSLAFYVETLGFEKRLDAPFGAGGRWIEVAPLGAVTTLALVQTPHGERNGIEVSLATRNAVEDHARLIELGVEADAEVILLEHVPRMFTFRDPDGNRFRMVERD